MVEDRNEIFDIDIQKLLMAYLRRWWLIVLAALVMAAASFAYTYYMIVPQYRASTTIYVNNLKEGATVESVTSGNLSASQQLVSTYINIVKSDRVMEKAAKALDDDYSAGQLKGMVSAAQIGETEIFAIYVTGPIPEETARIANTLAVVVPEEIGSLIEGSSARVIDNAKVPTSRYSPSYRRNLLLGALAGAVCVILALTAMFLLDVRIKDEEELTATFDLPVLGRIPKFRQSSKPYSYTYGKEKTHYEAVSPSSHPLAEDSVKAVQSDKNGKTK